MTQDSRPLVDRTPAQFGSYIDHTLLKPEATEAEILRLCEEATVHGFYAVCVNTDRVPLAVQELKEKSPLVAATIGFPLGAINTSTKIFEAVWATQQGARELDVVINIGRLKDRSYAYVENEITRLVNETRNSIKVILETALLTRDEIREACLICRNSGADFVKTSTGFGPGGARLEDVRLMRETVGPKMGVKASGGVRDLKTALEMIEAGATRIGTSSGIRLMEELSQAKNKG